MSNNIILHCPPFSPFPTFPPPISPSSTSFISPKIPTPLKMTTPTPAGWARVRRCTWNLGAWWWWWWWLLRPEALNLKGSSLLPNHDAFDIAKNSYKPLHFLSFCCSFWSNITIVFEVSRVVSSRYSRKSFSECSTSYHRQRKRDLLVCTRVRGGEG